MNGQYGVSFVSLSIHILCCRKQRENRRAVVLTFILSTYDPKCGERFLCLRQWSLSWVKRQTLTGLTVWAVASWELSQTAVLKKRRREAVQSQVRVFPTTRQKKPQSDAKWLFSIVTQQDCQACSNNG